MQNRCMMPCSAFVQDGDGSFDRVDDSISIVNLSSGEVVDGPKLPGPSSDGCAVVADGFVYLVRGAEASEDGSAQSDTSEVYRAKGTRLRFPLSCKIVRVLAIILRTRVRAGSWCVLFGAKLQYGFVFCGGAFSVSAWVWAYAGALDRSCKHARLCAQLPSALPANVCFVLP